MLTPRLPNAVATIRRNFPAKPADAAAVEHDWLGAARHEQAVS